MANTWDGCKGGWLGRNKGRRLPARIMTQVYPGLITNHVYMFTHAHSHTDRDAHTHLRTRLLSCSLDRQTQHGMHACKGSINRHLSTAPERSLKGRPWGALAASVKLDKLETSQQAQGSQQRGSSDWGLGKYLEDRFGAGQAA